MFDTKDIYNYQEHRPHNGTKRAIADLIVALIALPNYVINAIKEELGGVEFSAIYLLVNSEEGRIYVGETGNILKRLKSSTEKYFSQIGKWDYAILIWDGRPNTTSAFNDATLRKNIETRLIEVFKSSSLTPVNKVEKIPALTHTQEHTANSLLNEIKFVLLKLGLTDKETLDNINAKVLETQVLEEILMGRSENDWNKTVKTVTIDGKKTYYRVGTDKRKWFQITIKHHFLNSLKKKEDSYFLFARGTGYLVPTRDMSVWLGDLITADRETLDIYVIIGLDNASIVVGEKQMDISKYQL